MAEQSASGVSFHDLSAGGKVGELIRRKDWSVTPLGPRDGWPRSLSNHLSMIFELPTAAIIFWGPDLLQLYNDGYSVIMGPRHPQHLGSPFRACWPEAYPTIHPWMRRVLEQGETVAVKRTLVPLTRFGFAEEAYFTFSFSPLRDDRGGIAGILQIVTEVTATVLGERRAATLHELSNQTAHAKTMQDATRLAMAALGENAGDLPFALLYVADPANRLRMIRSGTAGMGQAERPFPDHLDLGCEPTAHHEIHRAIRERTLIRIENLAAPCGSPPADQQGAPITRAFAAPILAADQTVIALLVGGISPRLALDEQYRNFLELIAAQLAILLAAARAHEDERRRNEAMAEIDRAKTTFFSNISHEFRTPLTLILGPIEDALAAPAAALVGDGLKAVHRNALRLLRLVNSLLDFARIESGRLQLSFVKTDIAAFTADLASAFRSVVERAGLALTVDCPAIAAPVYVDPIQWEKIVLNLISNAFKFTFRGEIAIALRHRDDRVHLTVQDTGGGIPASELPHIFERFHRVDGAPGRSFEGTGIGLSLVHELVKLHGGSVRAESTLGMGSRFEVSLPIGRAHLPAERVVDRPAAADAATTAAPYLLEASQWLGASGEGAQVAPAHLDEAADAPPEAGAPGKRARVLVVDDNADMRAYLVRLLSTRWQVDIAEDGQKALAKAKLQPPDLVLSDVMMPGLDGFALLRALRDHPRTSHVPVVLLSGRAGEEAVLMGLETGADDYLVKPFAARELLTRVKTHLDLARLRREWAGELQYAYQELEAFSYSVAHDLRAPLRGIDGFSLALLEDYADKLDEDGQRYLRRMRESAQHMGRLIESLLSLARITRGSIRREEVDLSAVARAAAEQLKASQPQREVEFVIAQGVTVTGDSRLLAVVFDNLLGNSWKFTRHQPKARIEFHADQLDGQRVFSIRDNGAGFDMAFAAKLFGVFERLHTTAEFEGTGIGLATVQRIIRRHDGRIWADGKVGSGATFSFTINERSP